MFKFLPIFSLTLFMAAASPARADWCRVVGGGIEPCGTIPTSWTDCGEFQGDTVWCYPSGNTAGKKKSNNSTTKTLIYVGAGLAFVGVMWYIFKTPPSEHNPGQVKLMSF